MTRIQRVYRAMHEQAFIPIFTRDAFDSNVLLEGCLRAGLACIEYTLRRPDAHVMIPRIRREHPDLFLLAGSTVDDEGIVRQAKRRHPQLLTVRELDAMDVDGFVSMMGWSLRSIRRYSRRRIIAPYASTVTEAFQQVGAGAHFAKFSGRSLDVVRVCRAEASFDFCPVMVTGGMTLSAIPDAIDAGTMVIGSGFDLMLKGRAPGVTADDVAGVLKEFVTTTREARNRKWPALAQAPGMPWPQWLERLPHHHHF